MRKNLRKVGEKLGSVSNELRLAWDANASVLPQANSMATTARHLRQP